MKELLKALITVSNANNKKTRTLRLPFLISYILFYVVYLDFMLTITHANLMKSLRLFFILGNAINIVVLLFVIN